MRLAIVEDSSTMGRLWGHWLEGSGHTFTLFDSGPESLEAAAIITASLCVAITAWLQWEGWRGRAQAIQ